MAHLTERAYLLRHQQKDNRLKVLTSKAPGIPDINFINLRKLKAVFTLEATGVFKEGPLDWWFRYSRFGPIIWMLNSSWVVECVLSLFYCSHCFFHTLYIYINIYNGWVYILSIRCILPILPLPLSYQCCLKHYWPTSETYLKPYQTSTIKLLNWNS